MVITEHELRNGMRYGVSREDDGFEIGLGKVAGLGLDLLVEAGRAFDLRGRYLESARVAISRGVSLPRGSFGSMVPMLEEIDPELVRERRMIPSSDYLIYQPSKVLTKMLPVVGTGLIIGSLIVGLIYQQLKPVYVLES